MSDSAFGHVCKIEHPLGVIRNLSDALLLITETLDEPGSSAINEIVWTIKGRISELDDIHEALFQFYHPDRDRLEREGWPEDTKAAETAG